MPICGRSRLSGVLLVLLSLSGPGFLAETEFRVFRVNASLAAEGDDPMRGPDYYLAGGSGDGLSIGQRLEVYRDQIVTDPITGQEHEVRLPVGELTLISVDATASVARRAKLVLRNRAPLLDHHAVMIGDWAVLVKERQSEETIGESASPDTMTPVSSALAVELPSSILFDLDSAVLQAPAGRFSGVEDALRSFPHHHLIVEGHTCDLGNRAHNEKLALARARSVAAYLAGRFDIPVSRITVAGYGSDRPADPSNKERARNRRVEIRFVTEPERLAGVRDGQR